MTTVRFILALAIPLAALALPASAAPPEFRASGFYELSRDERRCASPMCGGYWVKRLNFPRTHCADRRVQDACYVAELRNAPEGLLAGGNAVLVQGRMQMSDYEGVGEFAVFDVRAAWQAATDAPSSGHYSGIENSGIVCITTPCESWDETVLNRGKSRLITGIELKDTGAQSEQQQEAMDIVAGGGALIARGFTQQSGGNPGLVFSATQLFLPLR